MFAALARAVTHRPWLVIVSWLVAAAALVLAAPGIGSVTNPDQAAFLPSGSESARAAALAAREFPEAPQDTAVIVVSRPGGTLSKKDIVAVERLADLLGPSRSSGRCSPPPQPGSGCAPLGTRGGCSPPPQPGSGCAPLGTRGGCSPPPQPGSGCAPLGVAGIAFDPTHDIAANRRVAMLVVSFSGPAERADTQSAVAFLRRSAAAAVAGTGLSVGMTGQAAVAADTRKSFNHATVIVTVATLVLIVTLLLLIFRSPVAALLPLLTVGLVYAVATALIACAGRLLNFQVGQELPTMLTVVLFGIGTDYVLFLLFRYRERLRAGAGPTEAVVSALARVGEVIASAALAVIAAFAALILARLGFFRTLGPALAIGVGVTLLAALTLVPATVTVLGRWTFWPGRTRADGATARAARCRFAVLGRAVGRRPVAVLAGGLVLLAALGTGLGSVRPSYDPVGQLPAGTGASRAFRELRVGLPAGALNPTTVYLRTAAPLSPAQLGQFTARLAAVPGVASPLPPTLSTDGRTAQVPVVLSAAPYSTAALDLVDGPLRHAAEAAAPAGSTVLLGGQTMAYAEVRDATHRDLAVIFPVAAVLFALILAGLLRALLAPVQLVVLVVAGFAATLGVTARLFAGSLAFSIPIVLYLFVTAIGTDYNILITARLREEVRDGRRPREAAALAVTHAGPSVAAAALILAGTFAALLISGVPFFTQIGFAVTLGIALVAYVVAILLVPACGALTASAAWWPSRPRDPATADLQPPRVVAGR